MKRRNIAKQPEDCLLSWAIVNTNMAPSQALHERPRNGRRWASSPEGLYESRIVRVGSPNTHIKGNTQQDYHYTCTNQSSDGHRHHFFCTTLHLEQCSKIAEPFGIPSFVVLIIPRELADARN